MILARYKCSNLFVLFCFSMGDSVSLLRESAHAKVAFGVLFYRGSDRGNARGTYCRNIPTSLRLGMTIHPCLLNGSTEIETSKWLMDVQA